MNQGANLRWTMAVGCALLLCRPGMGADGPNAAAARMTRPQIEVAVIVGGHGEGNAFFDLFEGHADIHCTPIFQPGHEANAQYRRLLAQAIRWVPEQNARTD